MDLNLSARAPAAPGGEDLVKDTSTAAFKADVIDASMEVPIIVDFWAPWCGPCKTLGPQLEKAVRAARGKVRMVKLDIDKNQALATQMRIQSIPAVYAFYQGRPVDAFVGALPESQVKAFVDKLSQVAANDHGGAGHVQELLDQAKAALDGGDIQTAGGMYQHILEHEPDQPVALAGLARCLIALGQSAEARQLLDGAPADLAKHAEIVSVRRQLELAEQSSGQIAAMPGLRARLGADPSDHQARLDLAMALYGAGQREQAVDELLELFRRDREWNDNAARKQLVKLFEAFGPTDPLTAASRKRLSSLMFS